MNNKTLGSISTELKNKKPDIVNPQEIQRAQEKEYLDNLTWCVKHALKEVSCADLDMHDQCSTRQAMKADFFVVALLKKEKLLENVLRNYFIATKDCPTPTYDQTVYRYNYSKGDIEFLWVIPDRETCLTFLENKDKIVPSERMLLQFVLDFYDKKLLQLCKRLNKETSNPGVALEGK